MVQAARSGKQNIIEGSEDGKTSTEMELKLLNVARSSIGELCEEMANIGLTLCHQVDAMMNGYLRSLEK
jgi:hypothetical protein